MMSRIARWKDLLLPLGIIASVLVILVPMPAWLIDLLLAGNITVAVIVLLTTIYVRTPLEFSVFPSLLLATTLGRLVMNIATTRLILGAEDESSAGGVVRAFGAFVAGEQIVIGLVIFVIIIVVQFVVITKGATRISEVAARFALDGMPGRQMAIDADVNAGIIDQHEAQRRREDVARQADFYGAMDGASKFVRGDAIAGVVITLINIVGGLIIGVVQRGMDLSQASRLFTMLTIGDGLVSQVPAFLISLAAGLLVTRSNQRINLPTELLRQLFSRPQVLLIAGGFLGVLMLTRLPSLPLLTLGGGCCGLALLLTRQQREDQAVKAAESAQQRAEPRQERIEDFLSIDPLEIEIGVGLIRLADPSRGGDLLARVTRVRQSVAGSIGIVLPKVRIRDNMRLNELTYRIKIANVPLAEGVVYPDKMLAIDHGRALGDLPGERTVEPALSRPAVWIDASARDHAQRMGYTTVEPAAVLATHLQEIATRHADELLSRDATGGLIDGLRASSPAVVDELIPAVMKIGQVQQVLQLLLREQVSIRPLAAILETLGDYAGRTQDPVLLVEQVRRRLARTICAAYRDNLHRLHVVTLQAELEDRIESAIEHTPDGWLVHLSPNSCESICHRIAAQTERLTKAGHRPVVLVHPRIRPAVKQLTSNDLPRLVVLSYDEVSPDTTIEAIGVVDDVD